MNRRLKIFSLEEANSLLPQIEAILAGFEEKREAFRRLQDGLFFEELVEDFSPPDEKLRLLEENLVKLEEEIEKIQAFGCILRHPDRGLIDFLARRDEKLVYYCWRRGEGEIQYYHTLRGGFRERQPLLASAA